jgi:hypothetical protein
LNYIFGTFSVDRILSIFKEKNRVNRESKTAMNRPSKSSFSMKAFVGAVVLVVALLLVFWAPGLRVLEDEAVLESQHLGFPEELAISESAPQQVAPDPPTPPPSDSLRNEPFSYEKREMFVSERGIRGKTFSDDGEPLPGVRVSALSLESAHEAPHFTFGIAHSDVEGNYVIPGPLPERIQLQAESSGYAPLEGGILLREEGWTIRDVTLHALEAQLQGEVIDAIRDTKVAGATINVSMALHSAMQADPLRMLRMTATSDRDGRFSLTIPSGRANIQASHPDYIEDVKLLSVQKGDSKWIQLRLVEGEKYALRVTSADGEALAGATVVRPDQLRVATDADGVARFPIIPDLGEFNCKVSASGYLTETFRLQPSDSYAVVRLQEGPRFTGTVRSRSGPAVANAIVRLWTRVASGQRQEAAAKTDSTGRFRASISNPPLVRVEVEAPGFEPWIWEGEKPASEDFEVTLEPARAAISGRVLDPQGKPVRSIFVAVQDPSQSGPSQRGLTRMFEDPNGLFLIELKAGFYNLSISGTTPRGDSLFGRFHGLQVSDGAVVEMTFRLSQPGVPRPDSTPGQRGKRQ